MTVRRRISEIPRPNGTQSPIMLPAAERLVGLGFRCWLAGYDTGDIACWETGWNTYAAALGADDAKRAVMELACWVRVLRDSSSRRLEYYPFGCAGFCGDECFAISLIAAAQHDKCPALRACAFALTGSDAIGKVIDSASAFAGALSDANQMLSPSSIRNYGSDREAMLGDGVH